MGRGGGHLTPQVENGGDPRAAISKGWEFGELAKQVCGIAAKDEFAAGETKAACIAVWNARLARRG